MTVVARTMDLAAITELVAQHGSLFEAARQLPRLGELHGRGPAIVTKLHGDVCVVRHYRRGGAVMSVLGDRYLRTGNRALAELHISEAARARGVATPAVQAIAWSERGMFRRYDIATLYIPGACDLSHLLFDPVEGGRAAQLAVDLITTMLAAGVIHRDLNLKNIVIGADRAFVLDLDRGRLARGLTAAQRMAMRARFMRSLSKWEHIRGQVIPDALRAALSKAFDG